MSEFTGFYPWMMPQRGVYYDANHRFVHPDGYRLSDRIWRVDARTRNRINELLQYEILNGTSAVDIAQQLGGYLQEERAGVVTDKPYGRWGSYDARRLARTEITAAHGRATIHQAVSNPFIDTVRWALSAGRDDWDCNCEENATAQMGYGEGVYPPEDVPSYPDHPHCMCTLIPQTTSRPSGVVEDLRSWLADEPPPSGRDPAEFVSLFGLSGMLWDVLRLWGAKGLK